MSCIVGKKRCAYCYVIAFIGMHLSIIILLVTLILAEIPIHYNSFSKISIPLSGYIFCYKRRYDIYIYDKK